MFYKSTLEPLTQSTLEEEMFVSYLGVSADWCFAVLTRVGEEIFVALDAEGVFFAQDVPMSRQRHVTVPAGKMPGVPVLVHGFCVFSREN